MPRIPPLDPPYVAEVQESFRRLMPDGMEPLALFRTVAHNPRVLQRMQRGGLLDAGSISIRQREIAILRTTALLGAGYEWGVHATFFGDRAQLTPAERDATARAGHDHPDWSDDERAVVRLCDALHARGTIDDEQFDELARHFSQAQILELTMLAGLYHAVSFIVNVSGVAPEPWAAAMPREASRAGTPLLRADGTASMASMLLMSHHAFRRDIVQLARALRRLHKGQADNAAALQQEWQGYRGALHGHHGMEDANIFPSLAKEHQGLAPVLARLSAEHQRIDPLLERGDRAFATIGVSTAAAEQVVAELAELLDAHLTLEEANIVPALRNSREFPSPSNETEAVLYADGFAWSSHGVAPEVLERVYALLPEMLTSKIPAARVAYRERCLRCWGSAEAGASGTSVPDWL